MIALARAKKFTEKEMFIETKKLLLQHGYEGFTFSLLAKSLGVSRAAIYKYYQNKEELISFFMISEFEAYLRELKKIHSLDNFEGQLEYLLNVIFQNEEIHKLIETGQQVQANASKQTKLNIQKLNEMHLKMYNELQSFIKLGREENKIKQHIPDQLILGIIFQTISIPNIQKVPKDEWIASIKEIICYGMFTK